MGRFSVCTVTAVFLLVIYVVQGALLEGNDTKRQRMMAMAAVCLLHALLQEGDEEEADEGNEHKRKMARHRDRKRKSLTEIFDELGPTSQGRAHRMSDGSFWKLHGIPLPHLHPGKKDKVSPKKHGDGAKCARP